VTDQTIFEPNKTLAGRYVLRNRIGRGGMGSVYLALDKKNGQYVALKMLHPKYSGSRQAVARFVREVTTSRNLNHPGIVKIFDARKEDNMLFYTMEYIEGKTLRRWLQTRHRLAFPSVVRVLCLVAEALTHAHRITIHRDLSPENIMVLRDGSIRLLDFGLAKLDDQFKGLTMVGSNLGKLHYMAPEQQSNPAGVDLRADIYSMGVMFYELLTGRAPAPGQKLSVLRPDLPPGADAFVEKALAPDPNQRFQSAFEFREELLKLFYSGQPAKKKRALSKPSLWQRLISPFKRLFGRK